MAKSTPILFRDRQGNNLTEATPGAGFLNFLYGGPFGKLGLWLLVKRKFFSVAFGKYMSSKLSVSKVQPFIEQYEMDMEPYVIPAKGWSSFNDFFYRKIKSEFRPIGEGLVSPADGRVLAFQEISDVQKFFIKGAEFDVKSFLQDEKLAQKYAGGSMVIVRLAPVDYHRYHFPATGKVGSDTVIKGSYYSVSPLALRKSLRIFLENQRAYCLQETEQFGTVLIADVGATLTGSIINTYTPNSLVNKGDEKGHFAFGGSTTVLLIEKGKVSLSDDILKNSKAGFETYLKMGETIGSQLF
ncbi:MAG: phosphatidylserine decarboxylase [Crocinitomicaceae bacterium]